MVFALASGMAGLCRRIYAQASCARTNCCPSPKEMLDRLEPQHVPAIYPAIKEMKKAKIFLRNEERRWLPKDVPAHTTRQPRRKL